jgi:hypothetical protein
MMILLDIEQPINYEADSLRKGLTLFAGVLLIYFCYTYKFSQFKVSEAFFYVKVGVVRQQQEPFLSFQL